MSALSNMCEITDHCKRSEKTILKWIRNLGFPAKKICGTWISDTELIAEWWKKIIKKEG